MRRLLSLVLPSRGQGGGCGCVITVLFVSGIAVLSIVAAYLEVSPA